ncbi:MAG: amidohydrolase family protein [Lachnospiraceae bacterium]|nr:amidohydrolase family protein [Lachnospiraceae bacterium]
MNLILKGNICYNATPQTLRILEGGYLICEAGISKGAFAEIPEQYANLPVMDYGERLIIPGLCDIHVHAPQYAFRGLGMDLELLDWLNTYTFPEESKYSDLEYADKAYQFFVDDLKEGATTRAVVFGTIHNPATLLLMEKLEASGLITMVGKVNMDRNSPDILIEDSAVKSLADTEAWIRESMTRFKRTMPILTPRFTPTCSDALMDGLGRLQIKYKLPVQSHLSENHGEIAWVKELCPDAKCYGAAYDRHGLFGGAGVPTIMAHCVWSADMEEDLIEKNGVFVGHCPQSNMNLSSGIAPIRRFMNRGIRVGLGSDVAGGSQTSIFRAMSDAIQVSKLYWRLVEQKDAALTVPEAFYLGTRGGGSFFGKVGSFDSGYEFDALVMDDTDILSSKTLSVENRLERMIYLAGKDNVHAKYVKGKQVK